MMKLVLLLAAALPAFAQCPYTFTPAASQTIDIAAGASAAPNTITVTTLAVCNWAYGADASWITFPGVTVLFGSGNGAVSWVADTNIGPGPRTGHISFSLPNGGSAVFTVVQAAPTCSLALNPASAGAVLAGGAGSFQVQTNCTWGVTSASSFLSLTSALSGSLNGTVSYAVAANVCVPARTGSIAVQAGGLSGPSQSFQINQDGSPGNLAVTPTSLTAPAGATTGTFAIATDSSCSWSAYSDVSWLSITGNSTGSGNYNLPYAILANTSAARTGSIHVGGQLFTVTQQAVAAPSVVLSAVVNGADYAQGAVSPGGIVAVFGSNIGPIAGVSYTVTGGFLPKTLGGVQVLFDAVAAPLLYVSASQVNAVAPYGVTGSTKVQVMYQGTASNILTLPVQPATPGILTLDRSGFGGGAILNQDLSVNTPANPAAAGSVVVIYCVGGGATNPASADGAVIGVPAPVLTQAATVTIGGMNAQVLYSGAVSYSIAGLTQINAIVPPGLTAHGQVPVVVGIGGVPSQSGVTVAIQ
jgi:uncharacterized protein (TIGR03437 family)